MPDMVTKAPFDEHGRSVVRIEASALQKLANELPVDFSALVQAVLQCRGRVIVSGVGKSGHVGRKISSTLASTGTPSYFVHAAEASHGDLGMVTKADLCLVISNSGETSELLDVVAYTQRFSIPMAVISSNSDSTLMKSADFKLTLPKADEACHIGMAPTTSTTMALALGDALAVTLMAQRNFSLADFHNFHPGGKLGAQFTTVDRLMHVGKSLPIVRFDQPMPEVLVEMTSKGFGIAIVCSDYGTLVGVISDGDLRRHMCDLMEKKAGDIANKIPVTVTRFQLAVDALDAINSHSISVLVVVDENNIPIGVLHTHDLIRIGVS